MSKVYINDVGTELTLDTGTLIGSASDQYIQYIKPDGVTTGSFDANLFSSYSQLAGAIGTYLLQHALESGDFDTPGKWKLQAFVSSVAGTWQGETVELRIFDTYE